MGIMDTGLLANSKQQLPENHPSLLQLVLQGRKEYIGDYRKPSHTYNW